MAISEKFLSAIEDALHEHWASSLVSSPEGIREMIAYHMGWETHSTPGTGKGKRLRPLLLLLVVDCLGKDWIPALPAAVAIEYLHNFSLIHDDIQDQSSQRHGRQTLWHRWGIAQAINTGDAMYTLSYQALINSLSGFPPAIVTSMIETFSQACLQLTFGQHLDLSFEERESVSESDYLTMIKGKTAALLGCCTRLGAILAHTSIKNQQAMEEFGIHLGTAFQIQDDLLGIWGDPEQTGKSIESDLASGKKTFPIIHALNNLPAFRESWLEDHTTPAGIERLMDLFTQSQSRMHSQAMMQMHTRKSLEYLHLVFKDDIKACQPLESFATRLLERNA